MTDPNGTGVPPDGAAEGSTVAPDVDDAINTESVNDAEEVASEHSGATPGGAAPAAPSAAEVPNHGDEPGELGVADGGAGPASGQTSDAGVRQPESDLAAERLADLQRLQAEYVNYKRRVDRDRALVQERAVRDVLESVLPVLDDIQAARDHGDLVEGPFAAIADKLETTLAKYGLDRFGAKGEPFDPMHHEALMHAPWPADDDELPGDATTTTVVTVLQPGYRAGEQVLRPARVAVADPD